MNKFMNILGRKIIKMSRNIYAPLKIIPLTIKAMIDERLSKRKSYQHVFINELYYIGISAIPIILMLGFSVGFIVVLLFPFDKISFGIENIYGSVYSTFILKELAPLLTALVVLVRSTISITIQLSRMKIGGEIQTLEILGINPIQYLGVTKIFAGVLAVPVLTIYFTISAFIASMISIFIFYKIIPLQFLLQVVDTIRIRDLVVYIFRTMVSGFFIFIIAIYNGITVPEDINMIQGRTIRAITTSLFIIIIFNFLVTLSIYGIK